MENAATWTVRIPQASTDAFNAGFLTKKKESQAAAVHQTEMAALPSP